MTAPISDTLTFLFAKCNPTFAEARTIFEFKDEMDAKRLNAKKTLILDNLHSVKNFIDDLIAHVETI